MCAQFLKLALLANDDSALMLAAISKGNKKRIKSRFNFELYDDSKCKVNFRFEKQDIVRLKSALDMPEVMIAPNQLRFSSIEGLCILLRRLAYPNRLLDLVPLFGRSRQTIGFIFNVVLNWIFNRCHDLVTSLNQWWLELPYLKKYAEVVRNKGAPLTGCFGFIDGTVHRICRPNKNQDKLYSGHKRIHCFKYQSTVTPNGLIANLYGPEPGRRHDSFMLKRSDLLSDLRNVIGAESLYLYGDSGYPLKQLLITPHLGSNLSQDQLKFNKVMSKMRICVEWEFADLYNQFAFISFKQNQKLYLQPVAKYFIVSTILKNCKTCLYGSQTSQYFECEPPSLEQYLKNNKDI